MKKTKGLMLLLLLCIGSIFAFGQGKRTVLGAVRDSTGNGVPGVTITVKGTKVSGTSDGQGNFKIVAPLSNPVLVFSSIGFQAQEVEVNSDDFLAVTLVGSTTELNEVVVTGFGARKSTRKITYAVTEVKGEDLSRTNTPNIVNALQGKVAGVMINQGAGGPSSSSRIRIRGNTSIISNNTQPLFVIDGVLIRPGVSGADSWGDARDFGNELKNLNPDDYESLTVLKGSAATALYGSDGQYGVVLITTKKGKVRKGVGVTFSHSQTFEKAYRLPDFQNEYGGGYDPFFVKGADGMNEVEPSLGPYYSFGPKFDGSTVRDADGRLIPWKANNLLDLFQTGKFYNTNVAVEGGSERTTFRFAYTNTKNNSVMPNNSFKRDVFTLRATQKLSSFLNLDASASYATSYSLNPILQGGNSNPLFRLAYSNSRHYDIGYNSTNYIDTINGGRWGTTVANPSPYLRGSMTGVFWSYYQNNVSRREDNLRANLDITATITPWLSLLVRGNVNTINTTDETKNRGDGRAFRVGGYYRLAQSSSKTGRLQAVLSASKEITNDIDGSLSIGGETNRNLGGYYSNSNTNGGFKIADIYAISNSVNAASGDAGRNAVSRLDAVYMYGDATWRDLVTMSFSLRNDWNSNLVYPDGHGDFSYIYPSVGLSYIFSESLKKSSAFGFLSYGKLRGSLGYTGSGPDIYKTSDGFGYTLNGNYTNPDGSLVPRYGLSSLNLGNQNLKPQRTRELEFGAEMKFLNNRLGIDIAWYKKNTFNQVIGLPAPSESGLSSIVLNAGNIQNQGIEISLTGSPVRSKNFQWNTTVNFTRNRNKIIDIGKEYGVNTYTLDLAFGADVQSQAIVGKDYGTIVSGYAYALVQDKGSPNYGKKLLKQNGVFWRSQDIGQGQREIGSMMEKFLMTNIHEFRYKDFSLFVQADAKVGGMMASATHQYGSQYGSFKSTLFGRDAAHGGVEWVDDEGRTRNDGIIPDGVFSDGIQLNGVDVSGMSYAEAVSKGLTKPMSAAAYYDGIASWGTGIREYSVFENSWVSLREVSVGYNLPKKFTSKIKFSSLRVSLVGRNLVYLYNNAKDNINPESIFSSRAGAFAEYGGLPFIRSYGFTVNAGF
ncbi:SusC/RagA family TonB-linked outer membrane protein [Foetidibacter luteolus]|uniref:SusC/RagA family TonB-linked outer membrane protein n=1 Tax=Foetidibacter luteolus TaxID=2608880 RepID=UPI00129B484C|nr:SusC/RagA family TonB-linked outer membrane protein [Foetidibacter luteolus]